MNYKKFLRAASAALMIVIIVTLVLAPDASAQSKYKTLYKFKGGKDGNQPHAVLMFDTAGNLYSTAMFGGDLNCYTIKYSYRGCGAVFQLTPNADGGWTEKTIYNPVPGWVGFVPMAGLIFDRAGNLFGTMEIGDDVNCTHGGCGDVFELTPNSDGSWTKSVLHSFAGYGGDGMFPTSGLIFDQAGNLYGTTSGGGAYYSGTVFELTPNADGSWTCNLLYSFEGLSASAPRAGLIFDSTGNLYGTTSGTPYHPGTVFELTPNPGGSWTEKVLYVFNGKGGSEPQAGLIFDPAGNLYGTTLQGGSRTKVCDSGCGVVFKLAPNADGSWTETVLHKFTGGKDGASPRGSLIFDKAGNLYGTASGGGAAGYGVVFKLTPNSKGGWNETVPHHFLLNPGAFPSAGLILDAAGNLYGTTQGDGTTTFGSVFEITP
jgi:uncharacterized repeat protein (TIGR03803 family)